VAQMGHQGPEHALAGLKQARARRAPHRHRLLAFWVLVQLLMHLRLYMHLQYAGISAAKLLQIVELLIVQGHGVFVFL
jgi:hypothetical protein